MSSHEPHSVTRVNALLRFPSVSYLVFRTAATGMLAP
jgi:hypothetical protein